jgi:hypothetical protein
VAVDRDALEAALAGTGGYEALEMVASDATGILAALDLEVPAGADLVLASSPQALAKDLAAHRGRLGILRASEVGPGVRALGWGKRSLFGVGRVRDLGTWPLMADLPKDEGAPAFDPADLWTFVAAGDVMLDRGVYLQLVDRGRGPDFPFAGGRARITGRTCCSSFGWALPKTVRTGDAGAVRDLLEGADRSIVNLEGPAPRRATFHAEGTSFSFRQDLLDGLANAGIDIVSLANNHIGDAGKKTGSAWTTSEPGPRRRLRGRPRSSRWRGCGWRSSGTTRSPPGTRPARGHRARRTSPSMTRPRTSGRRDAPERTSSSSTRTGASSTGRRRLRASGPGRTG